MYVCIIRMYTTQTHTLSLTHTVGPAGTRATEVSIDAGDAPDLIDEPRMAKFVDHLQ